MTWQEKLFCVVTGRDLEGGDFPEHLAENTTTALETLGEWERKAICYHFESRLSFEEIAARYHVPGERVRHFGSKALNDLRQPSRRRILAHNGVYREEAFGAIAI